MKNKIIISLLILGLALLSGCGYSQKDSFDYCQYSSDAILNLKNNQTILCDNYDNGISCSNILDDCLVGNNMDFSKCEAEDNLKNIASKSICITNETDDCGRCKFWREQ